MTEKVSPDDVLAYWIGETRESADALEAYNKLWFQKSFETDREIAERFVSILADLASGLASDWAKQGARPRLAAIIVLDQFSRNIFRGHKFSFTHDPLARNLMKTGLALGEDRKLSETERVFFYLPAEHSEERIDQKLSLRLYRQLVSEARPPFKDFCETVHDYAEKHAEVIDEYGRFPHRNSVLRRRSSAQEAAYLNQPGAGF